jgi:predicted ATPase/tetratricopeptide (TPR) repeat protein/DNA-binding XRE family transcriptional regulator
MSDKTESEETSFGEWLRQRRHILDLTQQELADQVDCARITLRRIESGTLKPSKELALILLDKLGVPQAEREAWIRFARGLSGLPETLAESFASKALTNLPTSLTSFIGREREQAEIINLIAKNRLVTLTGAGGIGKTRLSIQVASALLNDFPNGTWLVEFASLSDPTLVPQVIAKTLGLIEQTGRSPIRILTDFLQAKRALLILDNCEHLILACAQLSNDLLTQCPNVHMLVTSREPLNIGGETVWKVTTLSVPERSKLSLTDLLLSFESIRLFVERAGAVSSDFAFTKQNAAAITQICMDLDGIPLAIELAVARIRILSVDQIAALLANRFDLLNQGSRTAIPHHQTLRATIDWSYDLLTEEEGLLFSRLSVFAGGWTLKAAEATCAGRGLEQDDIFVLLSHLVDKSLVNVETNNGASRFQMLETIREYAREKLFAAGESEIVFGSHLNFFTDWAQQVEPKLHGPDQIYWLNQIETEHDNLRVALQWTTNNDVETGLRLGGMLGWFWFVRGYATEGIKWLNGLITYDTPQTEAQVAALGLKAFLSSLTGDFESVVKLNETVLKHRDIGDPRFIAWALRGKAAFTAWSGGDTQSAIKLAEQAIALSQAVGDEWHHGMSLFILGDVYLHGAKDYAMADQIHEKSLVMLRRIGDKFGIAHVLLSFGFGYLSQGNYAQAVEVETEALGLLRELGDKAGIGWTLANLYNLARFQGDYDRAQLFAEERLILWRDMGFDLQVAWATYDLGRIDIIQNNLDIAASHFEDSITFFQQKGSLKDKILCLIGPVHLLWTQGQLEHATQLFAAFEKLSKENHVELESSDQAELDNILTKLRTQLEKTQFARVWAEGETMSLVEALDFALNRIEDT